MEAAEISVTCSVTVSGNLSTDQPYGITSLVLLFIMQFGIGIGNIAFYCLGLSYIDDNTHNSESPGFLGAALASKYWGPQVGSIISLGVGASPFGWWLGWSILSPILLIIGIIIAMFPKRLLSTVVRQAANNIIEAATSNSMSSLNRNYLADISFGASMWRMLSNKILMFNAIAVVFIQAGIVNFFLHEPNYLQSRFFLPTTDSDGINNEWTSRLVTNLLKPPMVALSILVAGLIIAKANPGPRKLAGWNIITGLVAVCFFITYIFIECDNGEIAGAYRGSLNKPFCASSCLCSENVPFTPVCPQDSLRTYYSPCHAGCENENFINEIRVYSNCSCGIDTELKVDQMLATEGGCHNSSCQKYWIMFQGLTVLAAALLGSGLIGNIIISIRSVLPQDKSIALSIELWLVGLIVHVPGKITYRFIAENYCQFWASDKYTCFLHESRGFGDVLNIVTAVLVAIGVIFDILVYFYVKDLPLYGDDIPDDAYMPIPMQQLSPVNREISNFHRFDDAGPEDSLISNSNHPIISSIQNTQSAYPRSISPMSDATIQPIDATVNQQIVSENVYAQIRPRSRNLDEPQMDFRIQSEAGPSEISNNSNYAVVYGTLDPNYNPAKKINGSVNSLLSDRESELMSRGLDSPMSSNNETYDKVEPIIPKTHLIGGKNGRPLSPETDF